MKQEPALIIASIVTVLTIILGFVGVQVTETEADQLTSSTLAVFAGLYAIAQFVQATWTRESVFSPASVAESLKSSLLAFVLCAALGLPGCGTYQRPPAGEPDPLDFYWDQAQIACDAWLDRQRAVNPAAVVDFACQGQEILRPFYNDVLELFRAADARAEARRLERE
jgi:hypothetical protein